MSQKFIVLGSVWGALWYPLKPLRAQGRGGANSFLVQLEIFVCVDCLDLRERTYFGSKKRSSCIKCLQCLSKLVKVTQNCIFLILASSPVLLNRYHLGYKRVPPLFFEGNKQGVLSFRLSWVFSDLRINKWGY